MPAKKSKRRLGAFYVVKAKCFNKIDVIDEKSVEMATVL